MQPLLIDMEELGRGGFGVVLKGELETQVNIKVTQIVLVKASISFTG